MKPFFSEEENNCSRFQAGPRSAASCLNFLAVAFVSLKFPPAFESAATVRINLAAILGRLNLTWKGMCTFFTAVKNLGSGRDTVFGIFPVGFSQFLGFSKSKTSFLILFCDSQKDKIGVW